MAAARAVGSPSTSRKGPATRRVLFLFPTGKSTQHCDIENRVPPTFALAGPTGVGKTALALELAERLGAEIVGADAFQIYTGLPILTAQPTSADLARVPHHLVGCIPIAESFDAQRYAILATEAIADIHFRGRPALVVGGTGLYFRALLGGLAATPAADPALRAELNATELPALVERLRLADSAAPAQVDLANKRRVTRAIEIVETSGRPLADFRGSPPISTPGILLTRDRRELHARIETNVRSMFAAGVEDEVRAATPSLGPTAGRAIGCREIQALLHGELTRPEAAAAIVISTRQYAKRQLTWFRHQTTFPALDLTGTQHPSHAVESALRALRETVAS